MLAYSAQELLVEPYAGLVFGMSPGVTTKLAGVQHGGVARRDDLVAVAASAVGGPTLGSLRSGRSAVASLPLSPLPPRGERTARSGPGALRASVFALGLSNGMFAVAAIGSMMGLAGSGAGSREGTRMGLWGAAQAVAFGLGGLFATVLIDIARTFEARRSAAYALVFIVEALAFVVRRCSLIAFRIGASARRAWAERRARDGSGAGCDAKLRKGASHDADVFLTSSWSAADRRAPPPPMISPASAERSRCSTRAGASSLAAARSRRG